MPYADKAKQREYQRLYVAANKAAWFAGKSCVVCGSIKRLELDHIDPAEKTTHLIWSWSLPRRQTELAKCQVLCYDCHKTKSIQHIKQLAEQARKHNFRTYYLHACRCATCCESHDKRLEERRNRRNSPADH